MGTKLQIENLGQIKKADIEFGDLTVFVGPQATGKSITLQLLKLLLDAGYVKSELRRYGADWEGQVPRFFDAYFGEGTHALWQDASRIVWEEKPLNMGSLVRQQPVHNTESLFYVPAQRVLTLRNGWPRPFSDYSAGDPFIVRQFSEGLRQLMEGEFTGANEVFPRKHKLRKIYRDLLTKSIFGDFSLRIDKHISQKRLMLGKPGGDGGLPFMVWSTGQREFMPLLLAFYRLMPRPSAVSVDIDWVVIEEPEAGLHTRAISAVLLMTLGLLDRGYRVCISTHSPYVLDVVWALRILKEHRAPELVREIFDAPKDRLIEEMAQSALEKDTRVYYFDRNSGQTQDISHLDPGATDQVEAGWGGLSEFSGRVADVVAKAVARSR